MAKAKTSAFFCKECGHESAKWVGQCPGCREWNTMVEAPIAKAKTGSAYTLQTHLLAETAAPVSLEEISTQDESRLSTGFMELDRVLGGGIVNGSLTLVGGDPGIGKSTLLLQVCRNLGNQDHSIIYISGEESLNQIKMRADRLGSFQNNVRLLCETNLNSIRDILELHKPQVVVIDSIQTMYGEDSNGAPGSVGQVRDSTHLLMRLAKGLNISIFIVGHVTKEGAVAGPRMLEHMVDTVLYFEGEHSASYRIIRGIKNRFGSTNEIGVFEMSSDGLREVVNPSEFMLSGRPAGASGSVVTCSMEGTRPILLEIQALVCRSNFGMPRRTAAGTDYNRVNLLMAVLEKRLGLRLSEYDAYVNIAGGMRISEPSLDLGIAMALVSSMKERPIDDETIVFGEIGLSGEVRAVNMTKQRIAEAVKLGFKQCVLPRVSLKELKQVSGIELMGVATIADALRIF